MQIDAATILNAIATLAGPAQDDPDLPENIEYERACVEIASRILDIDEDTPAREAVRKFLHVLTA